MKTKSTLSKIFTLIVFLSLTVVLNSQTATWTGAVSSNWQNTANWDIGVIPNMSYDVVIPSGYTNKLVVNNINSAKSVVVQAGAELEIVLSGSIAVVGNTDVYGTLKMTNGSVTVFGDGHLHQDATLIIMSGNLTATNCICDTLSTIIYDNFNPEVYAWSHGDVVIQGSGIAYVDGVAGSPTICDKLTLNIPLKLDAGKALVVEGDIINNTGTEGIQIKSNATTTGMLMQNSEVQGCVHLAGSASKTVQWHYISSPITATHISTFNGDPTYAWNPTMEWQGVDDYSPWTAVSEGFLNVTQGYAVYTNPYDITFYGYLNYSNYLLNLGNSGTGNSDYQGWNLIGNPYTAPVNWDLVVAQAGFSSDIEGAIYFMDDADQSGSVDNYRYYVATTAGNYGIGTEDATSMIPVCQGFFVKTNADNTPLFIKKTHRSFVYQPFYKDVQENQILKLSISNNLNSDELIFRIVDDASDGFDAQLDARKLFPTEGNVPMIFSTNLLDAPNMAINSIPYMDKKTVLNIGVKAEEGDYNINIEDFSVNELQEVYLYDNMLKTYVDLQEEKTYKFHHSGGIDVERFQLVFFKQTVTNIQSPTANITVFPNPATDFISINLSFNPDNTSVKFYSQTGSLIKTETLRNIETTIDVTDLAKGIYILEICSDNRQPIVKNIAVR